MMMVGVVENELIADPQEPPTKGPLQVGLGQHLVGRAERDGDSVQQQDVVAAPSLFEVVRGDHDRLTGCRLLVDQVENRGMRVHIKARHRLIEQEDVGGLRKTLGHQHPLPLPTREIVQLLAGQIEHVEAPKGVVDRSAILKA